MSNLWFFRLRGGASVNQQTGRRRSSSERVPFDLSSSQFVHQPMSSSSRLHAPRGSAGSHSLGGGPSLTPPSGHVPPLHRKTLQPGTSINLADSLDNVAQLIPRVRVEFYVNENTLKERLQLYFIKNQRSSLRIRIIKTSLKLIACLLYVIRVMLDNGPASANCYGCPPLGNSTTGASSTSITPSALVSNYPYQYNYHSSYDHYGYRITFNNTAPVNWRAIIWVERGPILLIVQSSVAMVLLTEALLLAYLSYKGNVWQSLISFHFILEIVNNAPFMAAIIWPPLRNLFIPGFLNCWLAKHALENMFNDLHRAMQRSQSALSQRLMILSATLLCLIFTSVCGFQHFQRAGGRNVDLFESLYFVVVTFATVGYGDYKPDSWPSQLFMVIMICVALIVLPTQFEQLAYTWMERQKLGGSYSIHRAQTEKHVVVCSTTLRADTIMDFLNEFYAHPLLQDFYVVLLSPCELDTTMKMILQVPMWAQRVIYIQGSALKDTDLTRARMNAAEACFILAARNYVDRSAADEHTILRSWAVRDFAPNVPQYIQIFRPENKIHVAFAEHVVCEDEFKYALLANNCLCPGTSTLVTLLLHTSRGQEGQTSDEEWHRLYGKCSGNEIYHIRLGDSRFFGEYEGKSFTYASFHSHRKYGVALIGVQTDMRGTWPIMLNPGPSYVLKPCDICFYMNITKEENSAFLPASGASHSTIPMDISGNGNGEIRSDDKLTVDSAKQSLEMTFLTSSRRKSSNIFASDTTLSGSKIRRDSSPTRLKRAVTELAVKVRRCTTGRGSNHLDVPKIEFSASSNMIHSPKANDVVAARGRRPSIAPVPAMLGEQTPDSDHDSEHEHEQEKYLDIPWTTPAENCEIVKGFPPVSPYVGVSPTLCYLLKDKKLPCCVQISQPCEHCSYLNAREYNWPNRCIILSADYASNGIYNFIVPLRAHFHNPQSLRPIVLLLERRPMPAFIDAISWFPLVYWMQGSIDNMDDLIRAGINLADSVVVVNKESTNSQEEDSLSDCNTIVAVQMMFKMFPRARMITELSQSNNMRFMQFRAHDAYALSLSKMEKHERERGSHISYMFRLPFAAGSVFSASMLDTLLYQAFVKDYMITIVRLLLGIDQAPGSGFLSSMRITKDDLWIRTYGRLYQRLCSTTCEIPIGIYRTQSTQSPDISSGIQISFDLVFPISEQTNYQALSVEVERQEISNLVRNRMQDMGLPQEDYDDCSEKRSSLSYVIINPCCDLKLEEGDNIFIIRPSPINSKKIFLTRGNSMRSKSPIRIKRSRSGVSKGSNNDISSEQHPLENVNNSLMPEDDNIVKIHIHDTEICENVNDTQTNGTIV